MNFHILFSIQTHFFEPQRTTFFDIFVQKEKNRDSILIAKQKIEPVMHVFKKLKVRKYSTVGGKSTSKSKMFLSHWSSVIAYLTVQIKKEWQHTKLFDVVSLAMWKHDESVEENDDC